MRQLYPNRVECESKLNKKIEEGKNVRFKQINFIFKLAL